MLEHQLQNALPFILEKLRVDLREAKKDREIVGAKTPTNDKDRVCIPAFVFLSYFVAGPLAP